MTTETVPNLGDHPSEDPSQDSGLREGRETGLLGDSARIAFAALISRVTGLLRIVVAASVLGATVLGDLFVAINVLPLTLYDVFAGSALTSVLVPPLVRLLGHDGKEAARRFTANALGLITVAMAAVAAGAVLARPLLASALTAGVEPELAIDARSVAGLFLLLIIPQLVLYAAIGVFVSVQHAHHRFLLPSIAPVVENLGLLVTIAVAWYRFGSGIEVDRAPVGLILTLAIGSGLSVSAHAVVQFVGARRALGSIQLGRAWRGPDIIGLVGPAKASFGWSTVIAVRQFALVVAAGFAGAGGVQAFEIATLAYFIPVALIGRPIASAALPRLASNRHDVSAMLDGYRSAIRTAAWVAVPAGLALVLLGRPLAAIVSQGQFDSPAAVRLLTFGLAGLGIGAAADALFEVARQASMAVGPDLRSGLVRSTWIRAIVAIIGIPAAVITVDGPAVLLALGLVVSSGDLAALAVAHRGLRRHALWQNDGEHHGIRIVTAALIATGIPVVLAEMFGVVWSLATVALLTGVVAGGFAASAFVLTGRGRLIRSLVESLRTQDHGDSP